MVALKWFFEGKVPKPTEYLKPKVLISQIIPTKQTGQLLNLSFAPMCQNHIKT
jgi:hypothetical protein